ECKWRLSCAWPTDAHGSTATFRKEHTADQGCVITKAELVNKDEGNAPRNVKLEISQDRKRLIVSGDMNKPAGNAMCSALIKVEQECQSAPQKIDRGCITMAMNLNSPLPIPMQPLEPGWQVLRKQVTLQIWDGNRKAWEGTQGVTNAPVMLRGQ